MSEEENNTLMLEMDARRHGQCKSWKRLSATELARNVKNRHQCSGERSFTMRPTRQTDMRHD